MQDFELQPVRSRRPQQPKATRPRTFGSGLIAGIFAFIALCALMLGTSLIVYANVAASIPVSYEKLTDPEYLKSQGKVSAFQSMRIYDRNGELLNELFNPNFGRRVEFDFDTTSDSARYLRDATVATEDANFYDHQGIDFYALARAFYYAVRERELVSGASTIPQQLVKLVLLSSERTMTRKMREAILATEISRKYGKNEILSLYLNQIYYGNFAYGAEAAAETYFNKRIDQLTLAEAALLAGLPQAPSYYDPYSNPDRAEARMKVVLSLMVENHFVTSEQADAAWLEWSATSNHYIPLKFDLKSPHFTMVVRQQLEDSFGSEAIYQLGYNVYTTIDLRWQEEAERIVAEQVAALGGNNVSNGALVAIDPTNGQVMALVGSADFDNIEIDGQVNMALTPRQPGSTIKPLVYLANFENRSVDIEKRWTPGTLVADIGEAFPDGTNPDYVPTNYDKRERGLLTVRTALASSLNIPAVRAIQTVGVPYFLELAQRMGISTLTRPDYGLSLSLGAGEIPLLEMTSAFGVLANNGVRLPPVSILKITRPDNSVFCEQGTITPCQGIPGQQVIDAADAFLITDILSDNEARSPIFGPNSLLKLNRPAAAKTGTTNDIRDILTIGYTPQLVTGVWVGNNDNSAMVSVSGVSGAAPIWNQFMNNVLADKAVIEFTPAPGIQQFEVCADTGTAPSPACPEKRIRYYASDRPPLSADKDLYQLIKLDKVSGKLATEFTPAEALEERPFKVYPEQYRQWAEEHGIVQPPKDASDVFTRAPQSIIRAPSENEEIDGVITVMGSADAPLLESWRLEYGISHEPGAFSAPINLSNQPVLDGVLGLWDTSNLGEGPHTLRLVVRDQAGGETEARVRVMVLRPTPTPEPLLTPTWTALPTLPETPTSTPPVETPTSAPVIPTDTPVLLPTDTTVVIPTDTPVLLPTDTTVVIPTDTPPPPVEPTWTEVAPPVDTPTETPLPTDTIVPAEVPSETPTETPTTTP